MHASAEPGLQAAIRQADLFAFMRKTGSSPCTRANPNVNAAWWFTRIVARQYVWFSYSEQSVVAVVEFQLLARATVMTMP
jgi:hypothetical protein